MSFSGSSCSSRFGCLSLIDWHFEKYRWASLLSDRNCLGRERMSYVMSCVMFVLRHGSWQHSTVLIWISRLHYDFALSHIFCFSNFYTCEVRLLPEVRRFMRWLLPSLFLTVNPALCSQLQGLTHNNVNWIANKKEILKQQPELGVLLLLARSKQTGQKLMTQLRRTTQFPTRRKQGVIQAGIISANIFIGAERLSHICTLLVAMRGRSWCILTWVNDPKEWD